jgi:arginine-tRNA-protein transferase
VADFQPNRSQQRAWKQHASLTSTIIEPVFSAEHYALYTQYQKIRHQGGGMDVDDPTQYTSFLVETNVRTCMVEFRQNQPDTGLEQLKMVSTIDRVNDGLSAVYTFYAAEPGQNFGTFNVLWQIQLARALGLRYLYLGYWVASCAKMSYKSRFKPCELLIDGKWKVDAPSNFTR